MCAVECQLKIILTYKVHLYGYLDRWKCVAKMFGVILVSGWCYRVDWAAVSKCRFLFLEQNNIALISENIRKDWYFVINNIFGSIFGFCSICFTDLLYLMAAFKYIDMFCGHFRWNICHWFWCTCIGFECNVRMVSILFHFENYHCRCAIFREYFICIF